MVTVPPMSEYVRVTAPTVVVGAGVVVVLLIDGTVVVEPVVVVVVDGGTVVVLAGGALVLELVGEDGATVDDVDVGAASVGWVTRGPSVTSLRTSPTAAVATAMAMAVPTIHAPTNISFCIGDQYRAPPARVG